MVGSLRFSAGGTKATGQAGPSSTDASNTTLAAYAAETDDESAVDPTGGVTANAAATAKVAQAAIGGLGFGRARNPAGDNNDHKVLDDAADQSERAGIAHKMTAEGRDKLRYIKSAGTQYVPAAGNYADMFAKAGQLPTKSQQELLQRLDRLEQNVANTETLPAYMKVDPVGTRMEIAKLKAQLDGEVRGLVRAEAEFSAMKQAHDALKIQQDTRARKAAELLDGKTDTELMQALAENTPHRLGQGVMNSDVQQELYKRKQLGQGVGPAGRALTPEERQQRLDNVLGGLPEQDLTALTEHAKLNGPLAYQTRNTGRAMMTADPNNPQAQAEMQADDTHNRMAAIATRMTGGLNPTVDELLAARKKRLDLLSQNGMTPDTVARLEDTMRTMIDPAIAIMQQRNKHMTEAGLPPGDEETALAVQQLQSAARLQLSARTPQEKQQADKLYQDALANNTKQLERIDGLTKLPETRTALQNFVKTGTVNGSKDAALLLAHTDGSGQTAYAPRRYDFQIVSPDGVAQSYAVPLSNPAQAAYEALKPALERDIKRMEIADNPALNAAYGKPGSKEARSGLLPMERKEGAIAEVFKRIPQQDRIAAMATYTTDMQNSALVLLLNKHLGNQMMDKTIQDKFIAAGSSGSRLNAQFYGKDDKGNIGLDMGRLARALNEVGKGDVLDKIKADLSSTEFRNELFQRFEPQNLREKAMHAYLFGDQAFVAIDKNGIYNGRQTFNTWLNRTMTALSSITETGAKRYSDNAVNEAAANAAAAERIQGLESGAAGAYIQLLR